MTDKREQILSRLHEILLTLVGSGLGHVVTVVRNRGELSSEERPAIELWDADEEFDSDFLVKGRGRPAYGPSIMLARPKIYILLSTLDYTTIASQLHAIRANILREVMTDTELKSLCNDIYLERSVPDLDEMALLITFQYALYPASL
jgi:hypothetical protein